MKSERPPAHLVTEYSNIGPAGTGQAVTPEAFNAAMRLLGLDVDHPEDRALVSVQIAEGRITATYAQIVLVR